MSKRHKSILDPFIPASLIPVSLPLPALTPTTMTSQNIHFNLPATTSTPKRRGPAGGANLAAAFTVEDKLQALKAYRSDLFSDSTSPTTAQVRPEQPTISPQKRAMHAGDSRLTDAVPVSGAIPLLE